MSSVHVARCFISHEGDPYFNMAFDEWLFEQALRDRELTAFRLYTWKPGAITIGLNQRAETALDWQAVGDTVVIRRATGGRALYHDPSELTYSVILGAVAANRLRAGKTISHVSARLAEGLAGFLARQGVGAEFVRRSGPVDQRPVASHTAPCFASVARYELMSGGRKVVASAQRHVGDTVLQHGSIKMSGVAPHPALAGIGDRSGPVSVFQSIDYEWLKLTACEFFATMAETIGAEWELCGERIEPLVAGRTAQIMSSPLDRRDFQ